MEIKKWINNFEDPDNNYTFFINKVSNLAKQFKINEIQNFLMNEKEL